VIETTPLCWKAALLSPFQCGGTDTMFFVVDITPIGDDATSGEKGAHVLDKVRVGNTMLMLVGD